MRTTATSRRRLLALGVAALAAGVALLPAGAAAQTIKIGWAGPLTGDQAFFGKTWMNGAQMALDEANAKGGVLGMKLELVSLDDQADPKQATVVAQRHCDNTQVVAVIGHFNSGATLPAMPVYNKCRMLHITNSSNPRITALGMDTVFRNIANDAMQGAAPATYAVERLKAKRVAILHDKQAFGQGVADVFERTLRAKGVTITSVNGVTHGDVDFTAVLTKIRSENPDVVYFGGTAQDGGLILKQMRQMGLKAPYMGPDGLFEPAFVSVATPSAAEGALVSFQAPPFDSSPEMIRWAESYRAKFKEEPGPYSPYGYDQGRLMVDILGRAGKADREAMIKAVRTTKLPSILVKTIEFDDKGDLKNPIVFLYRVKEGKFVLEWQP
jgi:branched-chain amino acid transport system substrate-binding protein